MCGCKCRTCSRWFEVATVTSNQWWPRFLQRSNQPSLFPHKEQIVTGRLIPLLRTSLDKLMIQRWIAFLQLIILRFFEPDGFLTSRPASKGENKRYKILLLWRTRHHPGRDKEPLQLSLHFSSERDNHTMQARSVSRRCMFYRRASAVHKWQHMREGERENRVLR